ncbi:MAG: hypothetical protein AAF501_16795 [Pseudomonadota bacterium]
MDILGSRSRFYHPVAPSIPDGYAIAAKCFGHSTGPAKMREQESATKHRFLGEVLGICFKWLGSMAAIADCRERIFKPELAGVQRARELDGVMAATPLRQSFARR